VRLESGLEYEEIEAGTGDKATADSTVVVNYRGTLKPDGSEFDASEKHGGPVTFPLNGVIVGFRDGIAGMRVGGKRRITIPYAMAYGEKGRPPAIPPKADLVFEVELVKVE